MPLEEFAHTLEMLRARALENQETISASSARTREALVEPVLRALGWDTGDPRWVLPEYHATREDGKELRADYLLTRPGLATERATPESADGNQATPGLAAIRVLPLGHDALPEAHQELLEIAEVSGARLAVMTDGDEWGIQWARDPARPPVLTRLIDTPSHRTAVALMVLWPRAL